MRLQAGIHEGLLVLLLMLRLHPVLGALLQRQVVPLVCDVKLYKALVRLPFMDGIDNAALRAFWPRGLVVMLGYGLHPYKKLAERVCAVYSGMLQPLFEGSTHARAGNAGNWFKKMKLGKTLSFFWAILCAAGQSRQELDTLFQQYPHDCRVNALQMLVESIRHKYEPSLAPPPASSVRVKQEPS